LNLTYDELVSSVAFNCNLRHYNLGVIHRDLKPENFVLFTKVGGPSTVRVEPGLTPG